MCEVSSQEIALFTLDIQKPETRCSKMTNERSLRADCQEPGNAWKSNDYQKIFMRPLVRPRVVWPVADQLAICSRFDGCSGRVDLFTPKRQPCATSQPTLEPTSQASPPQPVATRAALPAAPSNVNTP
ncbi:hypothetical protein AUEXF2481DRAFT_472031 [Aureobasidium subglaciale EXF-2481]|uniref:Uncharacterized protein n=1 Tax=Aureobasidium subglaciale (strain EXF-2481) TaxID=1043005 RepID=A0A074YPX7_AURSE|nr:uncharacterized protein AUEXF2481DRAFT_472031 [Aureobasidium subglaciale EXF-2481]KEQ98189.1 hypothetical protein AUEXF2481DRAFT_472031 [Aureobasidium subglaciale EXF-2481]